MALELSNKESIESRNGTQGLQPDADSANGINISHVTAVVEIPVELNPPPNTGNILRVLGWNPTDPTTKKRLQSLLDRIEEAGIEDPDSYLPLKDAATKAGVAERTIRRYIADGNLETEKIKGPRGWEHRVYVPTLFTLLQEKTGAFERARSSPIEEMAREMASLCRMIVEQQSRADARTSKLLEEIRGQSRTIDELRAEQRDARAQMHALQDQMIRALMPRQRPPLWKRLFSAPYDE